MRLGRLEAGASGSDAGRGGRSSAVAVTRAPTSGGPTISPSLISVLAVAEVEAGAGVLVRQHQRGSGDQLLAVQVAAVTALEHRVQLPPRRAPTARQPTSGRDGRVVCSSNWTLPSDDGYSATAVS